MLARSWIGWNTICANISFDNGFGQTYVITVGIEGGIVHVHCKAEDLKWNLKEGKSKHFVSQVLTLCLVAIWYPSLLSLHCKANEKEGS